MTEDHFHIESLEAFERDLAAVGFERVIIAGLDGLEGAYPSIFLGID